MSNCSIRSIVYMYLLQCIYGKMLREQAHIYQLLIYSTSYWEFPLYLAICVRLYWRLCLYTVLCAWPQQQQQQHHHQQHNYARSRTESDELVRRSFGLIFFCTQSIGLARAMCTSSCLFLTITSQHHHLRHLFSPHPTLVTAAAEFGGLKWMSMVRAGPTTTTGCANRYRAWLKRAIYFNVKQTIGMECLGTFSWKEFQTLTHQHMFVYAAAHHQPLVVQRSANS